MHGQKNIKLELAVCFNKYYNTVLLNASWCFCSKSINEK